MKHRAITCLTAFTILFAATLPIGAPSDLQAQATQPKSITDVAQAIEGQSSTQTTVVYLPVVNRQDPFVAPVVPETTHVLSGTVSAAISSVSADTSIFTFTQATPALQKIQVGEVIVGDVSSTTPNGFLRRVTGVNTTGSLVVLSTTNTTLEEAIQQGEGQITQRLTPSMVRSSMLADGVSFARVPVNAQGDQNIKFVFKIEDLIAYDKDGDISTKNDQVRLNGSVELEPVLNLHLKIQNWKVDEFSLTTSGQQKIDLTVDGAGAEKALFDKEWIVATQTLAPMTLYIWPVPVVVVPVVRVIVGANGKVSVSVSAGATHTSSYEFGVRYANSTWNLTRSFNQRFDFVTPKFVAEAEAKAYAGLRVSAYIYGVVEAYAELVGYVRGQAQAESTLKLKWSLNGGAEARVKVGANILGKTLSSPQYVPISIEVPLSEGTISLSGPTATPAIPTPVPTRISTMTPTAPSSTPTPTPTSVVCSAPGIETISFTPNSPGTIGSVINVYAKAAWNSCFRAMRLKIDGAIVYESGTEWTYSWNTSGLGSGSHAVRVEVAAMGDNSWLNPTVRNTTYMLQPGPTATPVPCAASPIETLNFTPASPSAIGSTVNVYVKATWNNCFRSMRLKIDGAVVYELSSSEWTYNWNTAGFSSGNHIVQLEVASQGDNSWSMPSIRTANYGLQVAPTPTPVPCAAPPIEALTFTPSSPSTVGTTVAIYAKATWNSCFRSMRLKIDGAVVYELGSPQWTYNWNTTGYAASNHQIRLEVAAQGDMSWATPSLQFAFYALQAGSALSKPSLSSPSNGALIPPRTSITLLWNSVPNATQYLLEVWGGPYGGTHTTPCGWQSSISCSLGTIAPGNVLWRVKARDGSANESLWSDEWNFTAQ